MSFKNLISKLFGASPESDPVESQTDTSSAPTQSARSSARSERPQRQRRERQHRSFDREGDAAPRRVVSDEERQKLLGDMEVFVTFVVKALVDYPDEVRVVTKNDQEDKMIQVFCRASDRGKIIGKKGKTIMALRSLVTGAAGRVQDRISVEVMDEEEGTGA